MKYDFRLTFHINFLLNRILRFSVKEVRDKVECSLPQGSGHVWFMANVATTKLR
jgi:hypothetical protein